MNARKFWKKILPLALAVACLFAVSVPAMAEEIDPGRTGSVSVNIRAYATDDAVGGGSLHLYQIAETTVTAAEGAVYHYTEDFSGCSEDLLTEDELVKAETATIFSEWVSTHDVAAQETVVVSADGKAYFADLSCGLYMITQAEAAEGYNAINAFLVSVPLNEDGTWIYDVDATPKTSPVTKTEEGQCRLTFYLVDFHTLDPLAGEFVLINSDGQYAQIGQDVASANTWNPFVVTAYAAEVEGDVVWSDEANTFAIPLGGITFNGIGKGTYVLTEVNQPDEYLLPEESFYINVDSDGIATVTSCPYYEEQPMAVESGTAWDGVITVKNVKTSENTGVTGNHNPDGTGGTNGGNGNNGGSGTSGSGTSGSGNAKTGDYNFFIYGVIAIGAVLVIVVVLRRRANRTAQ